MSAADAIVDAAASLFSASGTATVEDVLRAAGVSRRTFYKHFRNQDDVLAAIYERVTSELTAAVAAANHPDPIAVLRTAFDAYLTYHVQNHRLLRQLVERAIRSDSPLHPLRAAFRAALVELVDAAVQRSTGRSSDPYVYLMLISGIEGLSLEILEPAELDRADVERARRVVHATLDALLGAPLPAPKSTEVRPPG